VKPLAEELFIVEYQAGAGSDYAIETSLDNAVDRIDSLIRCGEVVNSTVKKVQVVAEYEINVGLVPKKTS
jgi:hypothetical protein